MTTRALVLGGGGPVGIAWESGLLAGLAENGIDLSQADFIVGTSAGSFVGAQLAMGRTPATLAAAILEEGSSGQEQPASRPAMRAPDVSTMLTLITKIHEAISGVRPAQDVRAEIGAWALKAQTMSEETFIAIFGNWLSGLPENAWPTKRFACTAVDTADGSFKVWNNEARVGLARAVASSCSVPGVFPPITINGRRYIDGGMRSPTSADLAKGHDVVVVVALKVVAFDPKMAESFQRLLDGEIRTLRESGARVELIVPDAASIEAFGMNLMDPSRRSGAARAGLNQGRATSDRLRSVWK